jgi:hypothetical protein
MRMTFEGDELERLRHTTSKILLVALWVHVPIALIFGVAVGDNWLTPTCFMVAMGLAATVSWRTEGNGPSTRLVFAVALMADVSMFVFQFRGHAWQADMHMYFFVALACLVAYCDFRPIIAGTSCRTASSDPELLSPGGRLSWRIRPWSRRFSRRHPAYRGRRIDLARAHAGASIRDGGPEDS